MSPCQCAASCESDSRAPAIRNLPATAATDGPAAGTWTTDEAADSRVEGAGTMQARVPLADAAWAEVELPRERSLAAVSVAELRDALNARFPGSQITRFGEATEFLIRVPVAGEATSGAANAVPDVLEERYGADAVRIERVEAVGQVAGGDRHVLAETQRVELVHPRVVAPLAATRNGDVAELREGLGVEGPPLRTVLSGGSGAVQRTAALAPVEAGHVPAREGGPVHAVPVHVAATR